MKILLYLFLLCCSLVCEAKTYKVYLWAGPGNMGDVIVSELHGRYYETTYRKASFFWTRNPKLVNPMKEKRVWVQVAKNFEPFIKLTEEEVKAELLDFNEKITFKASELGSGKHKLSVEVWSSWQKHLWTDSGDVKGSSKEIEITIN